jgi:hypothetical protein
MRPILFCLIFALTLGGIFYVRNADIPEKPLLFTASELPRANPNWEALRHVADLNQHWRQVRNVVYPKIIIKSQGFKLDSCLIYEKDKNFRMVNWSFLGKESEIGSNKDYFWFWSKRMSPPALYYALHDDLPKTNLKTPFHPNWIMETIGINEVPMNETVVIPYKQYVVAMFAAKSNSGATITRAYLIDPKTKAFVGHYLFNTNGLPIVSAEITSHHVINGYHFPKEMTIIWFDEGFQSVWSMEKPNVNVLIDPKNWEMPDMKDKIDLNGYEPPIKVSQVF